MSWEHWGIPRNWPLWTDSPFVKTFTSIVCCKCFKMHGGNIYINIIMAVNTFQYTSNLKPTTLKICTWKCKHMGKCYKWIEMKTQREFLP